MTLQERMKKYAELDAARTQGEWGTKVYEKICYAEDSVARDGWRLEGVSYVPDYETPMLAEYDCKFASLAPAIYTDLQATVRSLEVARDALTSLERTAGIASMREDPCRVKAREAIQLIDQTLGEKKC